MSNPLTTAGSSRQRPRADPFWLCHECHAQMRPVQRDGIAHCASCNGEFIEILDEDVNAGPFGDLPPPPRAPSPDPGSGFFQSMFGNLLGAATESGSSNPRFPGAGNRSSGEPVPATSAGRQFSFNFPGGGRGSVVFGSIGTGNQAGLDEFFPGFPPNPQRPPGQDMLGALFQMLAQEGNLPAGVRPGALGDYAMTENGFDQILEQLMHAAGPQGPLPATEAVIEGLPRFTFDDKTLETTIHKDCPVCQDDYTVGDEVMKVPCGHIFHPACLQPWLRTNGSCPVCRFSLVPDEANRDAPPTEPQPLLTNMLNRLWGQGGTPATPSAEAAPTQVVDASGSDDPPVPDLSSAIPSDYRERHRRRERETEGNQQDRSQDEEYPSYFS